MVMLGCVGFGRHRENSLYLLSTQALEDRLHLRQQRIRHGPSETVTHQDALNDQVFAVRWHGIRRDQPTALAQTISKIIESERGGFGIL